MKLFAVALAFTATTSQANASGIPDGTPSADTALSIKEVYESSDGVLNYKTFQVEADAAGEYYAGFWLLPARHADKSLTTFYYATSEEMQGLNWKASSEKVTGSKSQVATLKILSIPKTGVYLVQVRTTDNSVQGIADVHIDNDYFYEENPISRSYRAISMPADGVEYASMTKSANPGIDDPMIFIHGNGSDRVVGWNDDGPAAKIEENNLDKRDAYISQVYKVPTSGISVSSTSSSRPVSKCHVITRMAVNDSQPSSQKKAPEVNNMTYISKLSMESEGISIPGSVKLGEGLAISSENRIKEISVFDMAGNMLAKKTVNSDSASMSLSSLNIDSAGVYVVTVATDKSKVSGRILVK